MIFNRNILIATTALICFLGCSASKENSPQDNFNRNQILAKIAAEEAGIYKELFRLRPSALPDTELLQGEFKYSVSQEKRLRLPVIVRSSNITNDTQIVLDLNNVTMLFPSAELGATRIKDDNSELAFTLRLRPSENFTLFRKIFTDKKETVIDENVFDFEYDHQGSLFYTKLDKSNRPYQVLSFSSNLSLPIYEEANPGIHLKLSRSRDGNFIFLNKDSLNEQTVWTIRSDAIHQISASRGRSKITGVGQTLFLVEERNNVRSLYSSPTIASPNWSRVPLPSNVGEIEEIDPFSKFLVLYSRQLTKPVLVFTDTSFNELARFSFSAPYYAVTKRANSYAETSKYLFEVSSPIHPPILFEFDLNAKKVTKLAQSKLPGFDPKEYSVQQRSVLTEDQKSLYYTVVSRKVAENIPGPALITAYGSYGLSPKASFDETLIPLLNRGFAYAICHVRGGGELGTSWKNLGTGAGKLRSVTDFISCTKDLQDNGIASKNQVVALGRSAGGTLVASALNKAPQLFSAAVLKMPFLSVLATLNDPSLPLAIRDRGEWGDPKSTVVKEYLEKYDPARTTKSQNYPPILIVSAENDALIPLYQTTAWIKNMKALNQEISLTHRIVPNADHTGSVDWTEGRKELAYETSYIINSALRD